MNIADLKKELDGGKIRPLYIFTGPERVAIQRQIAKLAEVMKTQPMSVKSFMDVVPRLTSKSLFAGRSLYVIDGDAAVSQHDLADILATIGKSTVVLVYGATDGRVKFFKDAADYVIEFERFTELQLVASIKKRLPVDDRMALLIAKCCGMDMSRIENECHKLKHLGKDITLDVLEQMLVPPLDDRIFDMVDLIARKRVREAYTIYRDLLDMKESPIKIISLLYPKFKQMFLVQSMSGLTPNQIMEKTGLTYYQVKGAQEASSKHSLEGLLAMMKIVQQMEMAFKNGRMDPYIGMDVLFRLIAAR